MSDKPNPETALRNEATDSHAVIEFRGEKFTVPLEYDDYPLEYLEVVGDGGNLAVQARALLGAEQWVRIKAMGLTGRGLEELREAIEAASGLSSGNSEASPA